MTNCNRRAPVSILRDNNNEIITETEAKLKRWKEYIEDLYSDNRPEVPPTMDDQINKSGPEITKSEVIHPVKTQKSRKATGPDNIHAETVKLIAEEEGTGLNILTALLNSVYKSGVIPTDWLNSTFITLPKKTNASNCDDSCPKNIFLNYSYMHIQKV